MQQEKKLIITYQMSQYSELDADDRELVDKAMKMTEASYAPYSNFHVGAAVRLENGVIVGGCNQENAAYPSGLCAERSALFAAGAQYPEQPVLKLAIACYTDGHFTAEPGAPCGACRQVMLETENRYKQPMRVLLFGANRVYEFSSAESLLPFSFISDDLKGGVRER